MRALTSMLSSFFISFSVSVWRKAAAATVKSAIAAGRARPHIDKRQTGKPTGLGKEYLHGRTQPLLGWMEHVL